MGRASDRGGSPAERSHQLWWFRSAVLVRCDNYSDEAAALRDAGLAG
jgi:hypothetical protein